MAFPVAVLNFDVKVISTWSPSSGYLILPYFNKFMVEANIPDWLIILTKCQLAKYLSDNQ
jgi:hypothetical protein